MKAEFKIVIPGRKQAITFTKSDIRALLVHRGETWPDLAQRLNCSRENLSRLVNGRADFPFLRKRLADELARMVAQYRSNPSALAMVG